MLNVTILAIYTCYIYLPYGIYIIAFIILALNSKIVTIIVIKIIEILSVETNMYQVLISLLSMIYLIPSTLLT